MLSKTIKIIIAAITILLAVVLFFMFKNKDQNTENTIDKAKDTEVSVRLFEELKNNHPEFSASQLEFYRETAGKNEAIFIPCEGRNDANVCIASVAFLKGEGGICGEIEDYEVKNKCMNEILKSLSAEKINTCWLLDDGHSSAINCLLNVFAIYDYPGDCSSVISQETRQVCESIFYYKIAFVGRDMELCKKISDKRLNQYCIQNIDAINYYLDSDNDGLPDYEEKNIYKTDPNKNDTDGDGYSDGIEIKTGHNPLGE